MTSLGKDPNPTRPGLVITAVGPDRPGLIFDLSTQITTRGGNIEDTKMSKLGGVFAVMMMVTGPNSVLSEIIAQRTAWELALGINCLMAPTHTGTSTEGRAWQFSISGFDRPGIVAVISDLLAKRGINVTSFLSRIENAPLTGTPLFVLEAECVVPSEAVKNELRQHLIAACDREELELRNG
jgi:glycine cleavage system transcriptional repressor